MNITLSVDEKTAERARKVAQAMGKSLNQLVRDYMEQLSRQDEARGRRGTAAAFRGVGGRFP